MGVPRPGRLGWGKEGETESERQSKSGRGRWAAEMPVLMQWGAARTAGGQESEGAAHPLRRVNSARNRTVSRRSEPSGRVREGLFLELIRSVLL